MPIPRVAIVGRPNVGKSSLLNLIAQSRIAIVDPLPGVTRDRLSTIVDLDPPGSDGEPKPVEVIDTGGFGVYVAEGKRYDEVGADLASLTGDIELQIAAAIESADMILFAVDVQAGITPQDEEIAKLLREQKLGSRQRDGSELVPVRLMATKVDSEYWETHAYELAGLGFGVPLMCSSKTKYMRRTMLDELYEIVPDTYEDDSERPDPGLKLAIVGKRNAGKSTLVNKLAGRERVIVSEIAGTTRDAIDVRIEREDGRVITAIDTAGLRRKKSFQERVEWYAFDRAQKAIQRADVVVLLIDALEKISQVDEQLGELVKQSYKPVIIAVNKWDLASGAMSPKGRPVGVEDYQTYVRKELKGLGFAPLAFASAKEGLNVDEIVDLAAELHGQATTRVGTGELNRVIEGIVARQGPTSKAGQHGRIYYTAQVTTEPPTLVLVVNRPEMFKGAYERYLMNRLREELPYDEVPIRVIFRSRKRAELAALRAGKARRKDVIADRMFPVDAETQQIGDEIAIVQDLFRDLPDDAAAYFDDDDED
ncbi:MAG: ribosome biogenesis GTPase Der [Planctomycetota bacterium]